MALSAHALTTLDTLKGELGLPTGVAHADDTYLERKINAVSGIIEKLCGRHFERQTIAAEAHPADGRLIYCLDVSPLVTLTSVSYDGAVLDASLYEVLHLEAGMVRFLTGAYDASLVARNAAASDPLPGTARNLHSFAYTGGYVLPKDDGVGGLVRDLPYDLEEACIISAATHYRKRGRDRSVQSEGLLGWSVTYAGGVPGPDDLPSEAMRIVERYRRISI